MNCSIIIVNWNARNYLESCLRSVILRTADVLREIIVVDNCSSDGSGEMVAEQFPEVLLLRNSENVGFVRGNNLALRHAKNDFILFLNPDAEVLDDAIRKMLFYLEEHQRVGVVGPQLVNSDGSLQNSFFHFPGLWSIFLEHVVSSKLVSNLQRPDSVFTSPQRVDVVRGACLLTRKKLLDALGGMNESLFMYSEETDLCFKIKKLGFSAIILPEAHVMHHERKSVNLSPNGFIDFHYYRSKVVFLKENYPEWKSKVLVWLIEFGLKLRVSLCRMFRLHSERDRLVVLAKKLTADSEKMA